MSDRPILVINQDLRSTHYENTEFNTIVTVKLPVPLKQAQSFINMDDSRISSKLISSCKEFIFLKHKTMFSLLSYWYDI